MSKFLSLVTLLLITTVTSSAQETELEQLEKIQEKLEVMQRAFDIVEAMPKSEEREALRDGLNAGLQLMSLLRKTQEQVEEKISQESELEKKPKKEIVKGINIIEINAKELEGSSDVYSYITWKTMLFNNSEDEVSDLSVKFIFRDKDRFELDSATKFSVSIDPGARKTVTGKLMMRKTLWSEVETFSVQTK